MLQVPSGEEGALGLPAPGCASGGMQQLPSSTRVSEPFPLDSERYPEGLYSMSRSAAH